ncbi:DUF2780 domain-containing protein [Prosthecomicrobium sp. N25]|uniref:DUF2780 domain-containing protein n=1 Tax=Prosthecomicrobium sp. N25 TaxID=3129254 RepID=UPI003077C8AC
MSHTPAEMEAESRAVQELVERIRTGVGLDEDTATRAVSIILNFLRAEAPPEVMAEILAKIPEADALMAAPAVAEEGGRGGMLSTIGGLLGGLVGGGMGGVMAAFTMLTDAGLDMDQVQGVTREVIAFARERAGDAPVDAVLGSIPGLAQFAG